MTTPVESGFNSVQLGRTDDGYSLAIPIGFSINYFGTTYSSTYVSNNGYLTFGRGQGSFSASGLGASYAGVPIIAAFFADVDTRNGASGITSWGTGTFAGHSAFGATWPAVGYYPSGGDKLDTFQILLVDRDDTGAGNFDLYLNYGSMQWGTRAAAGYNAGVSRNPAGTYFQLPGSLVNGALIDGGVNALDVSTNDGVPGQFLFQVRGGQVGSSTSYGIAAADSDKPGGLSGATAFTFTVIRSGYVGAAATLAYTVAGAGNNPATADLFAATSGTVQFNAGDTSATVTVAVNPAAITAAETFAVTLSAAPGTTISAARAQGIIEPNTIAPAPAPAPVSSSVTVAPPVDEGDVMPVSAAAIRVMRFFDPLSGAHFFTASAIETNTTAADGGLASEGSGFLALAPSLAATDPNAIDVYRFFDAATGSHFYTSSDAERDLVTSTRPDLVAEGIAFREHVVPQPGDTPVYRFFDNTDGSHFYTQDPAERASILAMRSDLTPEGIAFYAPSPT